LNGFGYSPRIHDFIYLTPLIPLSFKGEGEDIKKRGYASLKLPNHLYLFTSNSLT
jgi:hypothetical protein